MAAMIKKLAVVVLTLVTFSLLNAAAGQPINLADQKECPPPVYSSHEVARPAKITRELDLRMAKNADPNFRGRVVIEAVLCRTGRVTDIKVTEGSSSIVSDVFRYAVSRIEFRPAEMNWHTVSQKIQREFEIENGQVKEITIRPNGRLVESVDVIGNRRVDLMRIRALIQTRPGEPYDEARVKLDFEKLLATGQFDKLTTRVLREDGVRGGVVVTFELHELPVVGIVSFERLRIDPALVRQAWKDAQIDLQTGAPYWPEAGKAAIRVIKQVLDAKVVNYSKVELRTDQSVALTVNLTFVITNQ
jgi:Surface antigen variable number repeat